MGRIRHIEVWVQDKVAKKKIKVVKIATTENLADHLTKYLNQEGIQQHMSWANQWLEEGRHSLPSKFITQPSQLNKAKM